MPGKIKHGGVGTKLYRAWCNMKGRCYRKSMKGYYNYGGRGITVCEEWRNSFQAFRDLALAHGYHESEDTRECTLDRIDVNGDYCPDNCQWISNKKQQNNKQYNHIIEYNGVRKTIAEWAEYCCIGYKAMEKRFKKWSIEEAIKTPKLRREDVTGARYKTRVKPVIQYSKEGQFIKRYDCVSDAAREVGCKVTGIISVCKCKRNMDGYQFKTCKGFIWKYESDVI